ncbi:hypothetical protein [Oenococcus oeni]|uniref:hypothetical protein n=1 Tax=Oenococcus oeni TaxID=1247 RepID=UPI000A6C209A|nr:hypothetical protein [Oenococcus oeni]
MKKIIYFELLAFIREKFYDKKIAKIISIVFSVYLLFGYAISIFANSFIENHYDFMCLALLSIGLIGFNSADKNLTKFLKNIPCRFKNTPTDYEKIIFIKSLKHEVFTFISFITLLTIISFPLLMTKINMKFILSVVTAWTLFLVANKTTQVLSFVFYCKWMRVIRNVGEILFEAILIIYFLSIFGVKTSIDISSIFNGKSFKTSNLKLLALIVIGSLLYLLLYKTLMILSVRYNIKNEESFFRSRINLSNAFYKKILREMVNSVEFHFVSNLLFFPFALLIIKLLLSLSIISIGKVNFHVVFPILVFSQAAFLANFISFNLLSERKIIKVIIQAGYDLRNYLLKKAFVLFLFLVTNILLSIITISALSLIDLKTTVYCILLLFINGISLTLTVQIFSNISILYMSQTRFENSVTFPIAISVLFIQVMIEEMIAFMNMILKLPVDTTVIIMLIYIFFTIFINMLLLILLRRNFYGEYRSFIK